MSGTPNSNAGGEGTPNPAAGGAAPPAGGTPPPAAQPAGTPADWMGGLSPEMKGFAENKGFKEPAHVLESYRNLEKAFGVPKERLLTLPENMDDAKAMGEIYGRLGRPDKPEGYKIPTPEGVAPEFSKWASGKFHELGLTTKQGEALASAWNERLTAQQQQQVAAMTAAAEQQVSTLKTKWGAAHEQNTKVASGAARAFGVDGETLDKLESVLGYQKTMEFFHGIGSKLGEDQFIDGGRGDNKFGLMTPDGAQAKIETLMSDGEWTKRYLAGGLAERQEMEHLQKMTLSISG